MMDPCVKVVEEEAIVEMDLSCFSGNLRRNDNENGRDCWRISDGNNFRVRSKRFCYDKSKVCITVFVYLFIPLTSLNFSLSKSNLKMPGGKHLMDLVAVDWFKDTKRMDHVARRPGCAAQVSSCDFVNYEVVNSTGCLFLHVYILISV